MYLLSRVDIFTLKTSEEVMGGGGAIVMLPGCPATAITIAVSTRQAEKLKDS
jgi:hypothetical protein